VNEQRLERWILILGGAGVAVIALVLFLFFGPGSYNAEQWDTAAKQTEQQYRVSEQQLHDEQLRKKDESNLALPRFRLLQIKEGKSAEWGGYRFAIKTEGYKMGHHRGWVINAESIPQGMLIPSHLSRLKLVLEIQNSGDKPVPFPFVDVGLHGWETNEAVVWSPIRGVGFSSERFIASVRSPRLIDPRAGNEAGEPAVGDAALPAKAVIPSNPDQVIAPSHFATTVIEQPLSPEPLRIHWFLRFRPGISAELDGIAILTDPIEHGFAQYYLKLTDVEGIPLTP
jgi:hypothetical protein